MIPSPSQAEIERSLKSSLWDGAFWSVTVGFSEIYFSPFALFLGATPLLLGVLTSLPPLVGSLSQLMTSTVVKRIGSRKRLVLWGIGGQGLMLLLMSLIPASEKTRLLIFFLLLSLYWIAWMIQVPAWQSWIGDLVPEKRRGRYFGNRNRIIQIVTFLALIGAGATLNHFQKRPENLFWGFLTLLWIGALGRIFSLFFVGRQKDLPTPRKDKAFPSFLQFVRRMPGHSFGIFVLYTTLFSAAVNLSAPYFIPYFLEDLKFSYLQFMGLIATMMVSKYFFLPLWGRRSDEQGSRKPFLMACFLFSLNPFFLLFSKNYYYLLVVQMILGLGIAGFELLSFNFLLENTPSEERIHLAAYYETMVGIGTVVGALSGGWFLRYSPVSGKAYGMLFLLSGIARLALSLGFLPRLRENPKSLLASSLTPH